MNKLYKIFLTCILIHIISQGQLLAQAPDFIWAKQAEGTHTNVHESGQAIVRDAMGNLYVTGNFSNIITFGSIRLLSNGENDVFIVKYDATGNVLWAKSAGGQHSDTGYSLAVDGAGNVYVTGEYQGTATFGTTTLTSSGGYDVFIAKYDASGNVLWAKSAGGQHSDTGYSLAVDGAGNVYVTGGFQGAATFGTTTLTSSGGYDVFIAKYDASGNPIWTNRMGSDTNDYGRGVTTDGNGNVYVTGNFGGFSSNPYVDPSAFVAKYDALGNIVWSKQSTITCSCSFMSGLYATGRGIAVDGAGNIYVTGHFSGKMRIGTTSLSTSKEDVFIAKYDNTGNVLWAKSAGGQVQGNNYGYGYGIAVDGAGNAYVTGSFIGAITFGSTSYTSSSSNNMFIAKYDTSGNVLWAKRGGGENIYSYSFGRGIAVDGAGNAYVAGEFGPIFPLGSPVSFGAATLLSSGGVDVFIAKYDASGNTLSAKNPTSFGLNDQARSVAVDGSGNTYVTGYFQGTATFGTTTLTNAREIGTDIFIAKYDASGNVLWAKSAGGESSDYGNSIAVDGSGNAYVTGNFWGTATFGTTTLTSSGDDVFIAKYDASGNVLWAKSAGGAISDYGNSVAVDGLGNAYVTGEFKGTATFGTTTLTNAGGIGTDIFIAKYDASGNALWAKSAGGANSDYGNSVAVDGSGNSYVTGYFQGAATFGTTTLTNAGGTDIFIAKYDASGNALWAKSAGGANSDYGNSVAVDGSGNPYVTGYFQGTATFGTTTLTNAGGTDIFIAKYDASGNALWAKSAGGANSDYGNSVAVDDAGNAHVTGSFHGAATFGTTTLTSSGDDVFIAKYDASGNALWAKSAGGANSDIGRGIAVGKTGDAYVTGAFAGTAAFGTKSLTSDGSAMFLTKLNHDGNPTSLPKAESSSILLYPNPTNDKLYLAFPLKGISILEIKLLDVKGQIMLRETLRNVFGETIHTLDLRGQTKGVYFLQLITEQGVITRRVVKN
ncbi:SBBP repeat-containing protein [Pontibacter sp. H249]|uniref:SBBP repeat-containing protein n=1 Tax=Pontibacter sp. H249 TaxID=3133420 RepID=UPI0030C0D053